MTTANYRSAEPMYIIMVRDDNAERLLRDWASSCSAPATVEAHRLKIYDHRGYSLFLMHWRHGWENVMIWDCWNKRHIYLD